MFSQCRACLILSVVFLEVHLATGLRATGLGHERNLLQKVEVPPAQDGPVLIQRHAHSSDTEQKVFLVLIVFSLVVLTSILFHQGLMRKLEGTVPANELPPVKHPLQADIQRVEISLSSESEDTRFFLQRHYDAWIYYLMQVRLVALGVLFFEAYLLVATFFAGLLMLQEDSITTESVPLRFIDAFNFSIQTLATIGYGHLAPKTGWGHTIVTIEAYVGMVMVATGGGILFSRVNQPTSRLIVSDVACVRRNSEGQTVISVRVLNQRVKVPWLDVNASISVVLKEGNHNHVRPLNLRRQWNPILRGTWTLAHVVDESSPIRDHINISQADEQVLALIVFVKGVDSTYSKQVYAHQVIYTNQFRFGHDFADMIDYKDCEIILHPKFLSCTESAEEIVSPSGEGSLGLPKVSRDSVVLPGSYKRSDVPREQTTTT